MKRIIAIILLLVLMNVGCAETAPIEEWSRTFGGGECDRAESVQQTDDRGYIVVGETHSYGAGEGDLWLIKTDTEGNEEWSRTFGGSDSDWGRSVQQTTDGGYIVAGCTMPYGVGLQDLWLIKTDFGGNEEWSRTFGGSGSDCAGSVQQTTDGGYIMAGVTGSYGVGECDLWLIKTDFGGNEEWNRTFGGSDGDMALSVQQTYDSGYIVAGATRSYGADGCDLWLIKTDSKGNEGWNKAFGGREYDEAYSVQQTNDGSYIVAGRTDSYGAGKSDLWLIKIDPEYTSTEAMSSTSARTPAITRSATQAATPATNTSQQNKTSKTTLILGGVALLLVLVLLAGKSLIEEQGTPQSTSSTPKPVSRTPSVSSFDSHLNEAKSVIGNAEATLRDAMRRGVKISQSTQLLLHDAQKALETVDFAGAKAYAHKCSENVEVAVKEHEEKQAQKAREQQEMEQLRKEALNQIKVAKDSLEKAEKLGLPVQEANDMMYKARYTFESKYYKNAKNEAQQCVKFVNSVVKKHEEEQARKERERRELERLRDEAAVQIEIAKHLIEKSKKLGNPIPLDAEHFAQRSFDEGKYTAAKEDAQYLNNVIEGLIEESEPSITLKLPSRMQHNVWKCRDITITNNGTAHAKNIAISFSKALEARELKTIPQLKVGEEKTIRPRTRPTEEGDVPIDYIIQFTDLQEGTYKTEHTTIVPISREPELPASEPVPSDQFTTFRTVWDPIDEDFVWDAGKPDEYGELSRIKRWIEDKNPNIYWFLLKIVNHADHPVTEWNVTLYTEQAITILEAHLNEKPVRIMDERFDRNEYKKICVASVSPELGMSIPAKSERMMYFKMDIVCEGALKKEFGVFGVVRLGKSPQIEVPIREKRFTYKCKQGDFENMFCGSTDDLASQVMKNLQDSYSREIVQNFTNSFRLIREFEKYCSDRYAESETLIEKLEVIHSSLKAAEPITKDEILPLVEKELGEIRQIKSNVEAQKERGIRMCEKLIELLHIATSKIK
jgi:hypothetical protein